MENSHQFSNGVNPLAFVALLVVCFITLTSTERNAVKALLFTAAIIPGGQMFVIAGWHLVFFRIVIVAGVARVLMRGENRDVRWNKVDKLVVWCGVTALVFSFVRGVKPVIVGEVLADWGSYFVVRCLCKSPEDLITHLRFLALVMFAISISMWVESVTYHNPFAVFGGVNVIPDVRAGRVRCQGPFRIFILAGAFSATLFPLMVGLWQQGREHRARAALGIVGSLLGTYFCNSSGPLMCIIAAVAGFTLWPLRYRMYLFRRACIVLTIILALVMKAPVWYIIARVGDIFGGGSWHRSYLIDQFVQHFTQWALVGTDYTANWAPAGQVLAVDPNNMDITNNYIVQGLRGGIWQFVLFLAIITCCFKIVGRLVRGSSDSALGPRMIWAIGIALVAHCTAFIDISYFDQTAVFWYWLIAVISSFSAYIVTELNDLPIDSERLPSELLEEPEHQQSYGTPVS